MQRARFLSPNNFAIYTRICSTANKLNQSAEVALQQTLDKGYADAYKREGKPVIAIGVNFDMTERNIAEWTLQRV